MESKALRRHKRCHLKIMADILSVLVAREKTRKTHIMYGANLSYTLLNRYLNEALNANLIRQNCDGCYKVTSKGTTFLSMYDSYIKRKEQAKEKIVEMDSKKSELQRLLSPKHVSAPIEEGFPIQKKRNHREELEIVKDILEAVLLSDGLTKTFIMYGANLNYKSLTKYLDKLLRAELLRKGGRKYYLTEKGKVFLKLYREYHEILKELEKEYECLEEIKQSLELMLSKK